MTITTEIEWHGANMVPLMPCPLLCAIEEAGDKRVVCGVWDQSSGTFRLDTLRGRWIEPVRWAYMPDFPEEP